jgi:hypothetical protein
VKLYKRAELDVRPRDVTYVNLGMEKLRTKNGPTRKLWHVIAGSPLADPRYLWGYADLKHKMLEMAEMNGIYHAVCYTFIVRVALEVLDSNAHVRQRYWRLHPQSTDIKKPSLSSYTQWTHLQNHETAMFGQFTCNGPYKYVLYL